MPLQGADKDMDGQPCKTQVGHGSKQGHEQLVELWANFVLSFAGRQLWMDNLELL